MQPAPKPKPSPSPRENGGRPGRLGPALRIAISILIVWHFGLIFLAALSIPFSSPLVYALAQKPPMQWYLDALYLNQGHSFFAPEVGPGHVIYYELFDASNRLLEDGTLPNKKEYWPRLRYHRHFMLADQSELPPADGQNEHYWEEKYLDAFARHLLRQAGDAQTVRVRRYAHWPLPERFASRGIQSVYDEINNMREHAKSLGAEQGQTIDLQADQLERNATEEGIKRGYAMFKPTFEQYMGNRKIDEEGYEVRHEITRNRSVLGPEANQSFRWNNQRHETANRWNRGLR